MGDRAMAEVKTKGGSVFVYTHWGGNNLPVKAKEAIKTAKPRWDDYPYAAKIIVDQLTKAGRDAETGFGLMVTPDAEDEYNADKPSVVIDLIEQTLTVSRDGTVEVLKFIEIS